MSPVKLRQGSIERKKSVHFNEIVETKVIETEVFEQVNYIDEQVNHINISDQTQIKSFIESS